MSHIAHEIAGLRIDGATKQVWASSPGLIRSDGAKTSSRAASAVNLMLSDSLAISPVRPCGEEKPQMRALDPHVADTQLMLHYDNGVSLRLGKYFSCLLTLDPQH